jgi:hypothetical protein
MVERERSALLDKVRGIVAAQRLLDDALIAAVASCRAVGVDSVSLAHALGVHRATLYRRFPVQHDEMDEVRTP